ncbi:MAG: hypothetical protein KAW56_08000 [Candidatus Marinimicrobia bacterium]|nr:hypothetical protein [Candidatus Neomarinimicrobiota bacterium]
MGTLSTGAGKLEKCKVKDVWAEKKKGQEREAMLRGMSRAGEYWARIGAYIRREGFHPLELEKAIEWFDEGRLFFDDSEENNKRKAHCKICGKELIKGEGHRMLIYASNWYNLSFYFSCEECKHTLEITTLENRI